MKKDNNQSTVTLETPEEISERIEEIKIIVDSSEMASESTQSTAYNKLGIDVDPNCTTVLSKLIEDSRTNSSTLSSLQTSYTSYYTSLKGAEEAEAYNEDAISGKDNGLEMQVKEAQKNVADKEKKLGKAKHKRRFAFLDVDPGKIVLGYLTGKVEEALHSKSLKDSVKTAKESLKHAKIRLRAIKGSLARAVERKEKNLAKKAELFGKIKEVKAKIEKAKENANKIRNTFTNYKTLVNAQIQQADNYLAAKEFCQNPELIKTLKENGATDVLAIIEGFKNLAAPKISLSPNRQQNMAEEKNAQRTKFNGDITNLNQANQKLSARQGKLNELAYDESRDTPDFVNAVINELEAHKGALDPSSPDYSKQVAEYDSNIKILQEKIKYIACKKLLDESNKKTGEISLRILSDRSNLKPRELAQLQKQFIVEGQNRDKLTKEMNNLPYTKMLQSIDAEMKTITTQIDQNNRKVESLKQSIKWLDDPKSQLDILTNLDRTYIQTSPEQLAEILDKVHETVTSRIPPSPAASKPFEGPVYEMFDGPRLVNPSSTNAHNNIDDDERDRAG